MATFTLLAKIDFALVGPWGRGWTLHAGPPAYYTLVISGDGLAPSNGGNLNWSFAFGTISISGYPGITDPLLVPPGFLPTTNLKGKFISLTLPTGLETILYDGTLAGLADPGASFPANFFNSDRSIPSTTRYFYLLNSGVITARSIYTGFATNADVDAIWHGVSGIVQITGNYAIISWSWQIATGITTVPPAPASPAGTVLFAAGAKFAVSSGGGANGNVNNIYSNRTPNGTGPDLLGTSGNNPGNTPYGVGSGAGISKVTFSWVDSVLGNQSLDVTSDNFEDWTWFYFWFYLPDGLPLNTLISVDLSSDNFPNIPGVGLGTEFSGSVRMGTIQILTTLGSGIYKIVVGKTSDTVYLNNPNDNTTQEMAIPDPRAKTGFVFTGELIHLGALRYRVTGSGVFRSFLNSLNEVNSYTLPTISMLSSTNKEPLVLANFIDQRGYVEFKTTAINETFTISKITIYVKIVGSGYPQ